MAAEHLAETVRRLHDLIEPALEQAGFELVDLEFKRQGGKRGGYLLRITIDRAGRSSFAPERGEDGLPAGGVTVEDCVRMSREISPLLDVEDVIDGAYRFEVSSPGINRPLKKPSDFERATGHKVRVKTRVPVAGSEKFFIAPLVGAGDEAFTLDVRGREIEIPYRLVERANLEFEF